MPFSASFHLERSLASFALLALSPLVGGRDQALEEPGSGFTDHLECFVRQSAGPKLERRKGVLELGVVARLDQLGLA